MTEPIRPGDRVVIVKRRNLREELQVALNVLLIVFVGTGLKIMMSNQGQSGPLTGAGIENLKYFTVLSNILCGIVAVCWVAFYVINKQLPAVWKLVSASAVVLTMLIIAAFLAPLYPDLNLYEGGNLYFHRIVPLIALAEFFIVKTDKKIPLKYTFLAASLSLLYGMGYLVNNLVNGSGQWPDTNDWYGFLNWGYPVGMGIFAGVVLMHWGIALLLRFINDKIYRQRRQYESKTPGQVNGIG